jgi:hypothetical protein
MEGTIFEIEIVPRAIIGGKKYLVKLNRQIKGRDEIILREKGSSGINSDCEID